MRPLRLLFAAACAALLPGAARAAEPVTVSLRESASAGRAIVTVGDVADVTGGDPAARARVAAIDLAELKPRDPGAAVGRRAVEYRLLLAGFDPAAVRVTGAERVAVTPARRPVTVEEVTAAARAEVLRQYAGEPVSVELAVPLLVKLPDVPAGERVVITARPHAKPAAGGRVMVDMSITSGGQTLLSFAAHVNVRRPAGVAVVPAGGVAPPAQRPAADEILVRPRQRVEMQVNVGGLRVTAAGEAQQAGRLGQTIPVQNVDSKKTLSARVVGPGAVEIDLGGSR
jgi:hypothetical protein